MALACAPCTLTLNLHWFRMTTNGRILLSQLVLSCGMIASFVNSISPSLLFNTYWIALLMEYLSLFLGSISLSQDKTFQTLVWVLLFVSLWYIPFAFQDSNIFQLFFINKIWMVDDFFMFLYGFYLIARFSFLLFGSRLYESLNYLKAWTLHRHRTTLSTLLYSSYVSDSGYPQYPFRNSFWTVSWSCRMIIIQYNRHFMLVGTIYQHIECGCT